MSRFLCGDLIYVLSHDSSLIRLCPRYIDSSLIVVYYSGVSVVPKGSLRQRKARFSIIVM